MSKFQLGDMVKWTSQSFGVTSTKRGEVVCIVPAGERPAQYRQTSKTRAMLSALGVSHSDYRLDPLGGGFSRDHESYLVAVPAHPMQCTNKPKLYWPYVGDLEVADD